MLLIYSILLVSLGINLSGNSVLPVSAPKKPARTGFTEDFPGKAAELNALAEKLLNNSPDSAFKYAHKAGNIAAKYNLADELARSRLLTGRVLQNQGAFDHAIEDYMEAIENYQSTHNETGLAISYQYLGLAYDFSRQPEVALANYRKSLDIFQKRKDESGQAGTLSYIGHIYEKRQEYKTALEYQQQARKIYEKLKDTEGLAKVMDDIGSIYEDLENYNQAFVFFSEALRLNQQAGNKIAAINNLNNIGDIYQKQGAYQLALKYTFESLDMARELNQKYQLRSAYRDISQTCFLMGDFKRSYEYLDSAYRTYGEIYNSETATHTARMQVIYDTQEKDKEIALLEAGKRFNKLLIYTFGGALVIISALGLMILNRQRLLLLKNKEILKQNKKIYETEKELHQAALDNMQLNELRLTAELENKQLREQKLQDELGTRSRELTERTLLIIRKNEVFVELLEKLKLSLRKKEGERESELKKLIRTIEHNTQLEKNWNEFKMAFEQVHSDFLKNLQERFPQLTSRELTLCSLLRLNMNSKDLSTTLGISQDSLRVTRYRLRKKFGLKQGESLTQFIMSF